MPNIIPAGQEPVTPSSMSSATADAWLSADSSLSQLGLRARRRVDYEPGGYRRIDLGWKVDNAGPPDDFASRCRRAAHMIRRLNEPASRQRIAGWLAELAAITARRNATDGEIEMTVGALVSRLTTHAGYAVRAALLERTYRFFPTWAEIEVNVKELQRPFDELIMALDPPALALPQHPIPRAEPRRRRPLSHAARTMSLPDLIRQTSERLIAADAEQRKGRSVGAQLEIKRSPAETLRDEITLYESRLANAEQHAERQRLKGSAERISDAHELVERLRARLTELRERLDAMESDA